MADKNRDGLLRVVPFSDDEKRLISEISSVTGVKRPWLYHEFIVKGAKELKKRIESKE